MISWICERLEHKLLGGPVVHTCEGYHLVWCRCRAKTWKCHRLVYRSLPYKVGKLAASRGQILVGRGGGRKTVVHLRGER